MKKKIKILFNFVAVVCSVLILFNIGYKIFKSFEYGNDSYYSYYKVDDVMNDNDDNEDSEDIDIYTTKIDHTVKYSKQNISNVESAISLIENESIIQEKKCNNDLKEIEKEIKNITGIYGINLCEMQYDDAQIILEILKRIYNEYPFIRNYVTNLTLVNDGGVDSYVAAFKPSFTFATSNTSDSFPFVIKMQIFLNSSYYLNNKYFELVIDNAIKTKHFPKNTTKGSLVAHEFGHVITYVLGINYYNSFNTILVNKSNFKQYATVLNEYINSVFSKKIIMEAYNNYNDKSISREEFIKSISSYATTFDENGDIMYNETLAEAFHDYYINGENCADASKLVMSVFNKYIEEVF